jgi:hypothetical protein
MKSPLLSESRSDAKPTGLYGVTSSIIRSEFEMYNKFIISITIEIRIC